MRLASGAVALCPTRQRSQLSIDRAVPESSGAGLATDGGIPVEMQAASACVIGCTNRCIASNASSHPRTFTAFPTFHALWQHTGDGVKPTDSCPLIRAHNRRQVDQSW